MRYAALILLLTLNVVHAQVEPIVRVEVKPASVVAGQSAQMRVTVLVPTWFARPPVYPSFEIANAITRLPADSSFPTRESIGGESWSGIVRDYRIYPMLAARYRISGETISVSYASPGSEPVTMDVPIPDIEFAGVVPEGAEGLDPYLAGSALALQLEVEGDLSDVAVGDAIVLRYRAELDGLPAFFLPPLSPSLAATNISVYADEPEIVDADLARRSETLTIIVEGPGEISVPAVKLDFWNTNSAAIESVVADGLTVSVAGAMEMAALDEGTTQRDWRLAAFGAALAFLLIVLSWKGLPVAAESARKHAAKRRASERYAYQQLLDLLRTRKPGEVSRSLYTWLRRLPSAPGPREFALAYGSGDLAEQLDILGRITYTGATDPVDWKKLRKELSSARRNYLRGAGNDVDESSFTLNPAPTARS
jgi:hypothetical protein